MMFHLLTNSLKCHYPPKRYGTRARLQFEALEKRELMAADFLAASLVDASGDTTPHTVFQDGALRIGYELQSLPRETIQSLGLRATRGRNTVELELASSGKLTATAGLPKSANDVLIDLNDHPDLVAGLYQMQVVAETSMGDVSFSDPFSMRILDTIQIDGSFRGERFDLTRELDTEHVGIVLYGQGGTDVMDLGKALSQIVTINNQPPSRFDPLATGNLPIHQGYAVDHVVLENGSEIYFTGVEQLIGESSLKMTSDVSKDLTTAFTSPWGPKTSLNLAVAPDDPEFPNQWNLHVSDVPSAWRFTTGSQDVLLVSLDTGLLPEDEPEHVYGKVTDLTESRLITDETDTDNFSFSSTKYGHGHMATSVMSSTPNNGEFIAGINWVSDVFVTDLYGQSEDGDGVDLQEAIRQALEYAEQLDQRVVFQGGIQGSSWLTSGGTREELEALMSANRNRAIFAVAAGNFGQAMDDIHDADSTLGGVARLQTTHPNVMAVGALQRDEIIFQGLSNADDVFKAEYSNYGHALTLMGATDSPATYQFSDFDQARFGQDIGTRLFGGTSAANPNVAGIASLVWSAHTDLNGEQIRRILTDTAMKNLPNGGGFSRLTGKDYYYGHGLINADLAVRRAMALAADERLVNLDQDPRTQLVLAEPLMSSPTVQQYAEPDSLPPPSMTAVQADDAPSTSQHDLALDELVAAQHMGKERASYNLATQFVGSVKSRVRVDALLEHRRHSEYKQATDELFSWIGNEDLLGVK